MGTKMVSLRLDEELLAWATEYAASRGVSRTDLLETGLRSFREDCEAGVPELREVAKRQSSVRPEEKQGVGDCPERGEGLGHVWKSWKVDPRRSCEFCGRPGRDNRDKGETGGFFGEATMERAMLFSRLRAPDSAKGIKPKDKSGAGG